MQTFCQGSGSRPSAGYGYGRSPATGRRVDGVGRSAVPAEAGAIAAEAPSFSQVLLTVSWKDPALFTSSQAGLVNNLNDAVVWGLVPILLSVSGLPVHQIGIVAAAYPAVWGIAQLGTGALSDHWGRKWLIASGMWIQAAAISLFVVGGGLGSWLTAAVLLGLGTALVYPTLLAAACDVADPTWRASAVGVYRLWRDGGYAIGGLGAGLVADRFGLPLAIAGVGGLTLLSGVVVAVVMHETLSAPSREYTPTPSG